MFCCASWASGITITGYDVLVFSAGERTQSVMFSNPGTNSCYVRMTLFVEGRVMWRSGLLEPGESVGTITLSEALDAGTYRGLLEHECFSLEDKTPLNGLNMALMITVQGEEK